MAFDRDMGRSAPCKAALPSKLSPMAEVYLLSNLPNLLTLGPTHVGTAPSVQVS